MTQGEIDWWENPTIDLVPQLKRNKDITLAVKDRTGEIGWSASTTCTRRSTIRRSAASSWGRWIRRRSCRRWPAPNPLIKTDVGIFVPGTPMASTIGVEVTRGPKDYDKLKRDLAAAGYKGEKVVILAAPTIPTIWAEARWRPTR